MVNKKNKLRTVLSNGAGKALKGGCKVRQAVPGGDKPVEPASEGVAQGDNPVVAVVAEKFDRKFNSS